MPATPGKRLSMSVRCVSGRSTAAQEKIGRGQGARGRSTWIGRTIPGTFISAQEEGWPSRIDDPLSPVHEQDTKRRLHSTINNLNRCHERPLMQFHGGGDGQTVA